MANKKIKDETIKISSRLSKSKLELLSKEYQTNSITDLLNKLMDDKIKNRFSADSSRSVITSIGAKNKLSTRIIDFMPEHSTYIELFGNTASILLKKPQSKRELFNDIDNNITNFFLVIRDNPTALYNSCSSLPYSETLYNELFQSQVPTDPIEKATRFFYLNRCGFMGYTARGFRCDTYNRNYADFYYKECERFFALAERFKNVEITNKDYKKILKKNINDDAFFLCDPPYYDGTNYYSNSFTLNDYKQLAKLLSEIKGKAMVLHSKSDEIHKLFTGLGFRTEKIRTKYYSAVVRNEDGTKKRPNQYLYLYMNY